MHISTMELEDQQVSLKHKLAGLWTATMFCFLYADILAFYDSWLLQEILKGNMGPLGPITQELKLAIAVLMSIPAGMVFFSLASKAAWNRKLNIMFGALFTLITLATLAMQPPAYYIYFAVVEMSLTSLIVWHAWKWSRESAQP